MTRNRESPIEESIATGDLAKFAQQSLDKIRITDKLKTLPVFKTLYGLPKTEVTVLAPESRSG